MASRAASPTCQETDVIRAAPSIPAATVRPRRTAASDRTQSRPGRVATRPTPAKIRPSRLMFVPTGEGTSHAIWTATR